MTDINFEEMLENYLPSENQKGEEVDAIIVKKDRDYTYCDISGKLEGRVKSEEVEEFKEGDTIKVAIVSEDKDGNYVIISRRKIELTENIEKIKEIYEAKEAVTGKIVKRINGGYIVEILKINAFMPNSLSGIKLSEASSKVGKEIRVIIKEMKRERDRDKILVSHKDLKDQKETEQLGNIDLGDVLSVEVRDVLDFGLSVNINDLVGFIHISEISWKRVEDLNEIYKIGDKLEAKVIEVDKDKKSIKLSVKQLEKDPWETVAQKYNVGDAVKGKIVRVANFGAFVELEEGIEGLIHISDFAWGKKVKSVEEFVQIGDEVEVKIILLDSTAKKLKLSIKELQKNPWDVAMDELTVGATAKGKVVEVKDFGMFVELFKDIDAFVHISDYSWKKVSKDFFKIGDEVEVKIIEINKGDEKIKAGVKQLTRSPWEVVSENYKIGDVIKREITSITDFGLFIEVENSIDGMIHISEASKNFIKNLSEHFKVGDEVEAEIIEMNDEKEKIKLSIKKVQVDAVQTEEREMIEKYSVIGDEE